MLDLTNIETCYGPVMAIRGVSLIVVTGEITLLLGANGAGKTTVLKTISGTMEPSKGRIAFNGRSLLGLDPDEIARQGIGHVPEGREVFPFLTVEENLLMGAFNRRDAEVRPDIGQVYEYFPALADKARLQASLLSGGQQQMLAIGRALMGRPSMLLLDEPSLGLSPKLVEEIMEIIVRINKERRMTFLLVEQNAKMALEIGHFGYVMEAGRIVMENDCNLLRQAEDIQEFYLGGKDQGVRGRRRWKQRKTWR